MRAIIIEETRFAELVDHLKLLSESGAPDNTAERMGWDKGMWNSALLEAHRRYHYHFVKWAQSHGASCVTR